MESVAHTPLKSPPLYTRDGVVVTAYAYFCNGLWQPRVGVLISDSPMPPDFQVYKLNISAWGALSVADFHAQQFVADYNSGIDDAGSDSGGEGVIV